MAFFLVSNYDDKTTICLGCYDKLLYDHTLTMRLFDASATDYDEDLLGECEERKLEQFENLLGELNAGPYGFGVFVMKEGDVKNRGVCYKVDAPWEIRELLWFGAENELLEAGIASNDLQFTVKDASGNRSLATVRKLLRRREETSFDVLFQGDCFSHFIVSTRSVGEDALKLFEDYNASDLPW